MRFLTIIAGTLALAACAGDMTTGSIDQAGPYPSNYRALATEHVRQSFFDPYSIRDAEMSEPLPASLVFDGVTPLPHSGWMVCFRANAKNRFGAYTGRRLTGMLFVNGAIAVTLDQEAELQTAHHCRAAKYAPVQISS